MKPETEKAYRAWRTAAEKGYGSSNRVSISSMSKTDERIRKLKAKYEMFLAKEKNEHL